MSERLGVGIIGAGFVSKFHIRSWLGVRDADILGVCSRTKAKAESAAELARTLGVGDATAYASVTEMLRNPRIDALWICVPNFARLEIMSEVAKAGRGRLRGVACEKPLGRNVAEAERMLELATELGCPHGYLENQCFMPSVVRGRELIWRRGARASGRPYLARCAEEHGGPHEPWFWSGEAQGGGVLNDMMCHSLEAARFLLQEPGTPRSSLRPDTVSCDIATLKWAQPHYAAQLARTMGVDYLRKPAEDFARATVTWKTEADELVVTEATTSWSYVGPGLRLSVEAMGPEYSLQANSLASNVHVFFSREIAGAQGEDIVEKQTAEQGLMPIVASEEIEYGYTAENRHMVERFRAGQLPDETFADGLEVTKLLMACYMSSERGQRLNWEPEGLGSYIPPVARGAFNGRQ